MMMTEDSAFRHKMFIEKLESRNDRHAVRYAMLKCHIEMMNDKK